MKKSFFFFGSTIICVFALAWSWEFIVEPNLPFDFFTDDILETNSDRWKLIVTVSFFCFLALVLPVSWLIKVENERNRAIEEKSVLINKLQKALSEMKTLKGIIPICSHCKKIKDDKGLWNQLEKYIAHHSDAHFSHSICPACFKEYYPEKFRS